MSLKERLIEANEVFPEKFKEIERNVLILETKIAERKVFLSKKALVYKAKLRIDDENKTVRFFETLKETGVGISGSWDSMDISPGFGFKVEKYKISGKGREGTIEELSKLFGKDYKYSFDYTVIRKIIERETRNAGYNFSIVLTEKAI
ncbi:MAG: ribonucleoside-triphosphate reductase [Candidatus Bathyarchaeia archaeon]